MSEEKLTASQYMSQRSFLPPPKPSNDALLTQPRQILIPTQLLVRTVKPVIASEVNRLPKFVSGKNLNYLNNKK